MKQFILFISMSLAVCDIFAQPGNLEGNWSGSWSSNNPLTDRGIIRTVRVQSGVTGNVDYLFNTTASNYNPQWTGSNAPNFTRALDSKLSGAAFYYTGGGWNTNLQSSLTSGNYYTFIIGENSSSNNDMSVIETDFNPVTISTVSANPSDNPYIGQNVVISITTSGTPDADEYIYVRYTTNGWSSSSFVQATGSGTSWTATIPAQAGNTAVSYYVLSGKSSITLTHADADFQTLELNNNGGSNWNYTQQNVYGNIASGGACSGVFSDADCWLNGSVPFGNASVEIIHSMALSSSDSITNITIGSGATFTFYNSTQLYILSGGSITNNGSIAALGPYTVNFLGNATVTGTISFSTVNVSGAVDFGSGSTIGSGGRLSIRSGGSINTNAPKYASNSTLNYITGGSYNRGLEWGYSGVGTIGSDAGYPFNVEISNSSLNLEGSTPGVARACGGSISILGAGSLSMSSMTASLTVLRNLTNNGTLTLSSSVGGDLYLGGAFINNNSFVHNNREVVFEGNGNNSVSGTLNNSGGVSNCFSYLRLNKTGGSVSLSTSIYVSTRLQLDSGTINLNVYDLTLGTSGTVTGSLSNNIFVNTNSTGQFIKNFSSTGSFVFPIGTTGNYTPVTLNFTSGTFLNANAGARSSPNKHSNNSSSSDYLVRYWTLTQSGISSFTCDISCVYVDADIIGTESNIYCGKYSGGNWTLGSATNAASNTLTYSGATSFSDITGSELSALPVKLVLFTAQKQSDQEIKILWQTASELNNSHFELEKMSPSGNFELLSRIEGAGNSSELVHYSAIDPNPLSINYYRLKQIDFDGKSQYFGPVAVQLGSSSLWSVYPNPAKDVIHLNIPKTEKVCTVRITNLLGELVDVNTLNSDLNSFRVDHLLPGFYFIHIDSQYENKVIRWLKE